MTRYARASIIASALCVECTANCVLETVDAPKTLREDLDKLPPIAKLDAALRMKSIPGFDRSRHEVQQANDLIRARNDYVHPKSVSWRATLHDVEDAGNEWMLPFVMHGETWSSLGIPKQTFFWTHDASLSVLRVLCNFLKYLFEDLLKPDEDMLNMMLTSRLEFGNVLMPALFEEFKKEIGALKQQGVDFSFLRIPPAPSAA